MSHFTPAIDSEKLKAQISGLTVACPVTDDNPAGCQLHNIRALPARDRATWLASASLADLRQIVTRHQACMKTRVFMQSFE